MIVSWFFISVAMKDKLRYIACRFIGIVTRMVSMPSDFVTDTSSVTFAFYYAVDGILLG